MTLSLPNTAKLGVFGAALVYTAAGFATLTMPTVAEARDTGNFYVAELAQPAEQRTVIAGGIAWKCSDNTCVAGKGNSRPMRICRELQRDVGDLVSFTANGEQLEADKLEKCNR